MTDRKIIITAGIWVLGIFGLSQLLRLGSNIIVTRLLEPEMFGLMAIVYVVMHGVNMFSDLGFWAFIVRHKQGTEGHLLDTVWTMQVVRGWLMFLMITLIAMSLALLGSLQINLGDIYGNDKLPILLLIVGITAVVGGHNTMASAIVSRDLKRGRLESIGLIAQVCGTIVMLFWAWKFPSIWALVSAGVVSANVVVLLTYKLFKYRHKFAWNKKIVEEVLIFGKWIFIASMLTYLAMQGDRLIFASYISAAELGVYSIAFMLVGVFTNIMDQLNSKLWFPVLSKVANEDPESLKERYYFIRLRQDFVIFFGIGLLVSLSPRLIDLLYDERYQSAGWMMQVLSFSLLGASLSNLGLECLSALSITKIRMKVMAVRSLSIFIALPILFHYYGLLGGLWGVVLGSFIAIPVQYLEMKKQKIFSFILEVRMVPMIGVGYVVGYWTVW